MHLRPIPQEHIEFILWLDGKQQEARWIAAACSQCGNAKAIRRQTPNHKGKVAWLCSKCSLFETDGAETS